MLSIEMNLFFSFFRNVSIIFDQRNEEDENII